MSRGSASRLPQAVLAVLTRACDQGQPAPSSTEIAREVGASPSGATVQVVLRELVRSGAIAMERTNHVRRRYILPDGRTSGWTAGPVPGNVWPATAASVAARNARTDELGGRLLALLEQRARAGDGMAGRETLAKLLGAKVKALRRALDRLQATGAVVPEGGGLRLTASGLVVGPRDNGLAAREPVLAAIERAAAAGLPTPTLAELAERAGVAQKRVYGALRGLVEGGRVRIEGVGQQRRYVLPDGSATAPAANGFRRTGASERVSDAHRRVMGAMFRGRRREPVLPPPDAAERERLLEEFRARGGQVTRCPTAYLAPTQAAGVR